MVDLYLYNRNYFSLNRDNILSNIFKVYNIKYNKNSLMFNDFGKPKINNIFFNISHSYDLTIIGISQKYELGIDIEKIVNIDFSFSNIFCSAKELYYINNVKENIVKNKLFYTIWTLKEAYLKATGVGLNFQIDRLNFNFNKDYKLQIDGILQKEFSFLNYFDIKKGYTFSICVVNNKPPKINIIDLTEI